MLILFAACAALWHRLGFHYLAAIIVLRIN